MQRTIDETNRRREKQLRYNEEHGITPRQIQKGRKMADLISANTEAHAESRAYIEPETRSIVADPVIDYMNRDQLEKSIERTRRQMQEAAKKLDFIQAAQFRDEMLRMEEMLKSKS